MLVYPNINNVALQIGSIKIYWYGIMYLFGFAIAWLLAKHKSRVLNYNWTTEQISDLIFYCALGVIFGGRIGYVLFYSFSSLLSDPFFIFKIWHGGMSFHGGVVGVIFALYYFARKMKLTFLTISDFFVPLVPLGLMLGRIGNFINSELWGHVTTMPWGMVSANGGPLPRHPSQLYEASLEGLLLFIILWVYSSKPSPQGTVSALFLIGYGIFRFFCEFFRTPDVQLGFIAFNWLTMGQILSIPMIVAGVVMMVVCWKSNEKAKKQLKIKN